MSILLYDNIRQNEQWMQKKETKEKEKSCVREKDA